MQVAAFCGMLEWDLNEIPDYVEVLESVLWLKFIVDMCITKYSGPKLVL